MPKRNSKYLLNGMILNMNGAQEGHLSIVKRLLNEEVEEKLNSNGELPIHAAWKFKKLEIVTYMKEVDRDIQLSGVTDELKELIKNADEAFISRSDLKDVE